MRSGTGDAARHEALQSRRSRHRADRGRPCFLASAKSILARVGSRRTHTERIGSLKRGTLAVQASQTIASYWLPRHWLRFGKPIRRLRFVSRSVTRRRLRQRSKAARRSWASSKARWRTSISRVRGCGGPTGGGRWSDHPWGGRDHLTPGDLTDGDWVLREPGSGTRSAFEDDLSQLGIEIGSLRIQLELPSNEAVRAAVEAGPGCDRDFRLGRCAEPRSGPLAAGGLPSSGARIPRSAAPERCRSRAATALLNITARSSSGGGLKT